MQQNMRPISKPDFNSIFEDMLPLAKANPDYINAYLLTGSPEQKLVAAMIKDMPQSQAPAAPTQAPTQTVIDQKIAESQGLAQLAQGMPQQGPAPQQMAQAQGPVAQMAYGGIVDLPMDEGMFDGNSYAGGGIIAFDDGGDVHSYASRGAVKVPAYMNSPVGQYFNPNDLATYDDTEIKKLLLENPRLTMDDIYKKQEADRARYGIKNIYEDQKKALEEDKAENEKFKSSNEADALLNAAAGFLGNRSQFFGPGAEAALKGYTSTKREGQKEYRANAKDIRNLGFEIGRSDQAMRQAEMAGDQSLFNSERARYEGLVKESRDINYKNVEAKNNLLSEGAKSGASYKTNMDMEVIRGKNAIDVAKIRESGDDARARAKAKSDMYNKAQDNAITQMSKIYPLGAQDIKFSELAQKGGYKSATDAYNAELEQYRNNNIVSMAAEAGINPKEILNAKPAEGEKPATMAKPAESTISGKLVTIPKGDNKGTYELLSNGNYKKVN